MTHGREGQHPAGRRPAGQAAELRGRSCSELGENLIKASVRPRGARAAAEDRGRGHPGRRLHARAGRLRARRDDPRASALPEDRDHLHLRHSSHRHRPAARLRDGRGRLRAGAGHAGGAARQGQGVRRALPQDPAARAAERRAGAARRRAHRRAGGIDHAAAQSEQRRSLALAAGNMGSWDWDRSTGECVWDDGQYRIFGVEPSSSSVTPRTCAR